MDCLDRLHKALAEAKRAIYPDCVCCGEPAEYTDPGIGALCDACWEAVRREEYAAYMREVAE